MKKSLLVGSVFINDSEPQQQWLDLQLRYLRATTHDFDHVVVLASGIAYNTFGDKTTVLVPQDTTKIGSPAHCQGLNLLLEHFLSKSDEYENFLFIDSDAFPIRKNWMGTLLNQMQATTQFDPKTGAAMPVKGKGRDYDIAAALRCENLETRLHASVLFVKHHALANVNFACGGMGMDLAGNPEEDVYLPTYQHEMRNMAMPLLRTNKTNVHPLACGIYYDMFYHHAAGSGRPFFLRAADTYLQKFVQPMEDNSAFTKKLMENPNEFVHNLAGWSPRSYATI